MLTIARTQTSEIQPEAAAAVTAAAAAVSVVLPRLAAFLFGPRAKEFAVGRDALGSRGCLFCFLRGSPNPDPDPCRPGLSVSVSVSVPWVVNFAPS